jgi:iron(III) transport system ATP-binding protein
MRPDDGEIWISGRRASAPDWLCPPSQRSIGFVFQSPALWPHMTVAQNILFGLDDLPPDLRQTRLGELLARAEIPHLAGRYPHEISGGEAQRVSLLRAIGPKPRYLLMDEPLTNLDADLKETLLRLIRECTTAERMSLVYVTHHPDEARAVADRTLRLTRGSLVGEGPGRP